MTVVVVRDESAMQRIFGGTTKTGFQIHMGVKEDGTILLAILGPQGGTANGAVLQGDNLRDFFNAIERFKDGKNGFRRSD